MSMEDGRFDQIEDSDEWIDWLEQSLAITQDELDETLERLQEVERVLDEVRRSPLWRLDRQIAQAGNVIAPPGTGRRRVLHLGFRGLRALPRVRHGWWVAQKFKLALGCAGKAMNRLLRPLGVLGPSLLKPLHRRGLPLGSPARFPAHDRVDVSIVIPAYNHCKDTLSCLESIAVDHGTKV